MIREGTYTTEIMENRLYDSPWNIAADFRLDMSFNPDEIATMLEEYEADHGTGMDITAIAEEIHGYTSGYPFLVSRICQCIDEELDKDWTRRGIQKAVKIILEDKSKVFNDIYKNLETNKELYGFLYDLLFRGIWKGFDYFIPIIDLGHTHGFLSRKGGNSNQAVVSNRIFEMLIYEYFISKDTVSGKRMTGVTRRDVVGSDRFDMELCLRKFADHYAEVFSKRDEEFIEREGRLLFLSFLKPLINGKGFYHIESQLLDFRRMDIVVDFGCEQFIIELKLWKGEAAHEKAYEQLAGYLDSKGLASGYLLTFDFRKNETKQPRAEWVDFGDKRIFDVVI